jgi:hypothetical protein
VSLRLVAEADPTTIALWDQGADEVLARRPEFVEQLKRSSDRTQAIAGFYHGAGRRTTRRGSALSPSIGSRCRFSFPTR